MERSCRSLITQSQENPQIESDNNKIDFEMIHKYALDEAPKDFIVNSFERIAWADPFPHDKDSNTRLIDLKRNSEIINDPEYEQVYPDEKMFSRETNPMPIYIPSKSVMFKMMRSCIGVKSPKDLWIQKMEKWYTQ